MFCARCPVATERCKNEDPPTVDLGDRKVKCFLYEGRENVSDPLVDVSIYTSNAAD